MRKAIVLLVVLVVAVVASAQQRSMLSVTATVKDDVGKTFVYQLRSEIAQSGLYTLVEADSQKVGLHLEIVSVTANVDGATANNLVSAISVVTTLKGVDACSTVLPLFLNHWAVVVGRDQTKSMAQQLLASIDEDLDEWRKAMK